ncbi:MAG: sigma-54-dependent transcriptional regulator [Gammaproteobacteria bacterium]
MNRHPILLVEDDLALREALAETLRLANHGVLLASDGTAALEILRTNPVSAVVTDFQMAPMNGHELLCRVRDERPQLPVLLMTAHGTIEHAVRAMLEGASDYLVKPFSAPALLEKLERIIPRPTTDENQVIAEDPGTIRIFELARKVATRDITVLLTGESGTGKEVVARYIHRESERADGPFVAINCAAIPENMLEAVLFGHEKGAFTGAHEARCGKFEQAQGGTLLLDEISEMDKDLQAKLLRVLQEREVERIGARSSIPLDVRIVATTNRNLMADVQAGSFREDLFYRLSVFPIDIPPLRERRRDILPLARHFAGQSGPADEPPAGLCADAEKALLDHEWPGNVRQLQNVLQRATLLCSGQRIRARDLQLPATAGPTPGDDPNDQTVDQPAGGPARAHELRQHLQSIEGRLILDALERGGNRNKAAELLGISPRTLRYKIARLRDAGIALPGRYGAVAPPSTAHA